MLINVTHIHLNTLMDKKTPDHFDLNNQKFLTIRTKRHGGKHREAPASVS